MNKQRIVILGAGYGGLMTAIELQRNLNDRDVEVILVNKHAYHYQTTWLHETAAGTIHHDQTRIAINEVINPQKIHFIKDTVVTINPEEKKVKLKGQELAYDTLVIGLGFETETFGIPGLKENAFMIGTLNKARLLREHLAYNFAQYHNEEKRNPARLNIVIGGGGFTGVELLGELANRIPELCAEYDIDKVKVRMINIESSPTVLPGFDPDLVEYAMNSLEMRGVEFVTGASLRECGPDYIVYEKGGRPVHVPTLTTIWAAGVRANTIVEEAGFPTKRGKIPVTPELRAPGYKDVFVVGDCASIMNTKTNQPFPPTAQMAIQQAKIISKNIVKEINGEQTLSPFEPKDHGTVASLGHNDAIAVLFNNWKMFGWKATFMKKMIDNRYLMKLGGFDLMFKKGKFNFFY